MQDTEFVYPGSFDPFTNGHFDVATRAARLCQKLHVVILSNQEKKGTFTKEERQEICELCVADYPNIEVHVHEGLLVDYMRDRNLRVVVRGLRSESDFRFELQMAETNRLMYPEYETILLPSKKDFSYTSSSIVREIAGYGGDISQMVPAAALARIKEHYAKTS